MTPEGKVKAKVKRVLSEYSDLFLYMPVQTGYGRAGIPDFVGCISSKFFAIECKAGRGDLTALQVRTLQEIRDAGGKTWVVNEVSMDKFIKEFSEWVLEI